MAPEPFEIMGVVNVTPDSFSDGGEWFDRDEAVTHGLRLRRRRRDDPRRWRRVHAPHALPVPEDEELRRAEPVVRVLARSGALVSIDTTKLAVAEAALDAGARYVNDVTAFREAPDMAGLVADRDARCCLMHMLGDPRTMQDNPRYANVVDDVRRSSPTAPSSPCGRDPRGPHRRRSGHRVRQDADATTSSCWLAPTRSSRWASAS